MCHESPAGRHIAPCSPGCGACEQRRLGVRYRVRIKMAWAGEILTHQVCENQATTLRISNKFLGVVSWSEHLADVEKNGQGGVEVKEGGTGEKEWFQGHPALLSCLMNRECVCRLVCLCGGWEGFDGETLVPVSLSVWMYGCTCV